MAGRHPHVPGNSNCRHLTTTIRDFCEARDWDQFHSPKELAIGIVTEASELLEEFRFLSEDQIQVA